MSKLIEKHLARLAARLEPKPVQENITKILEQRVQRHDPKSKQLRAQYSAHFDDLFSGLTTLEAKTAPSPALNIAQIASGTADGSFDLFKTAYYHGKLTHKLASAAVGNMNLKVYEVASMFRLVEEGGTLVKWSHGERLFFDLQAASRFWGLKYQPLAKRIICDSIEQHWAWIAASIDRMPAQQTRNLVQALRAASPEVLTGKLLNSCHTIKPMWIMWAEIRDEQMRDRVLDRMEAVLHREVVGKLRLYPFHPALLRATPSTDSQVMDVLLKSGLLQPVDPSPVPGDLLSLSER